MLTVGLTGGIGSGKSLVSKIFNHLGVPVFNADTESKILLNEDTQIKTLIIRWLGPDIYTDEGLDRQKLADIIFNDRDALDKLNGLIHPRVTGHFMNWCKQYQTKAYVIQEAAILFETGLYRLMNTTILVIAPEEIRINRVKERDKTTEESIRRRMANQWTDEAKQPLADYCINNDGKSPLLPRVLEIHKKLIG